LIETPVKRSLLATFIEYAATDRGAAVEWDRFVVQPYQDEQMENARRECVRILGGPRKRPTPRTEGERLYSIADDLGRAKRSNMVAFKAFRRCSEPDWARISRGLMSVCGTFPTWRDARRESGMRVKPDIIGARPSASGQALRIFAQRRRRYRRGTAAA
jgi:hypothetical protein